MRDLLELTADRDVVLHAFTAVLNAELRPRFTLQQAKYFLRTYLAQPLALRGGGEAEAEIAWRQKATTLLGELLVEGNDAAR